MLEKRFKNFKKNLRVVCPMTPTRGGTLGKNYWKWGEGGQKNASQNLYTPLPTNEHESA